MISRLLYWCRRWRYRIHQIKNDDYVISKRTIYGAEFYDLQSGFWWPKGHKYFTSCVGTGTTVLEAYHRIIGTPSSAVGQIISPTVLAAKLKLKGQS